MSAGTPHLIALTGPAGAGKDSVADCLQHLAGYQKMAFADALRAEVCISFGVPLAYLTTRETKEEPIAALAFGRSYDWGFAAAMTALGHDLEKPRSPREVMQLWATEYRRAQQQDYWIDLMKKRLAARYASKRPVVITDCRFANEAQMVRAQGGLIWRVERPGFEVQAGAHVSETEGLGLPVDAVIVNDGALDELGIDVLHALEMGRVAA